MQTCASRNFFQDSTFDLYTVTLTLEFLCRPVLNDYWEECFEIHRIYSLLLKPVPRHIFFTIQIFFRKKIAILKICRLSKYPINCVMLLGRVLVVLISLGIPENPIQEGMLPHILKEYKFTFQHQAEGFPGVSRLCFMLYLCHEATCLQFSNYFLLAVREVL